MQRSTRRRVLTNMRILISLLFAGLLVAADPATKPITDKERLVAQSLMVAKAQADKPFDEAFADHQATMCKARKIKADVCVVDWQHNTVSVKPKEAPKPAAETPPGR